MMSSRGYLIACITLTLTGCAGMKDDFDCKAVASDSCMTMRQADEMARDRDQAENSDYSQTRRQSSVNIGGTGRVRLPSLIDMSNSLVPVRKALQPQALPSRVLSYAAPIQQAPVPDSGVLVFSAVSRTAASTTTTPALAPNELRTLPSQACTPTYCPQSMQPPQREIETVVSLWIAPYVDSIEAVHPPAEVFFVKKPTDWRDRYEP